MLAIWIPSSTIFVSAAKPIAFVSTGRSSFSCCTRYAKAGNAEEEEQARFGKDPRTESTKEFYDQHVDEYIDNINRAGITHVPLEHFDTFTSHLQQLSRVEENEASSSSPEQPLKILELGCGYGRDAEVFHKKGMNVIGTDYSRSMLQKAQASVPGVFFLEMDHRDIGKHFISNSLHGIWACATIIHLPKGDIPNLFKNMLSLLHPGGCVYVSVKRGAGETFDPDERYGGIKKLYSFYEEEEIEELFVQAGFQILECGVSDHTEKDSYATHPFIHVFARKPHSVNNDRPALN